MNEELKDIICKCKDCGNEFNITAGEQEFFQQKELSLPKRCKDCRLKNKNKHKGGQGDGRKEVSYRR